MTLSLQRECKCQNRSQEHIQHLRKQLCGYVRVPPTTRLACHTLSQQPRLHNAHFLSMWLLFLRLLDSEGEGTVILHNIRSYVPSDRVSYPRRLFSKAPLCKAHNICRHSNFTVETPRSFCT